MVRGTFSPARAWRPAAGARLARTLGNTISTAAAQESRTAKMQLQHPASMLNEADDTSSTAPQRGAGRGIAKHLSTSIGKALRALNIRCRSSAFSKSVLGTAAVQPKCRILIFRSDGGMVNCSGTAVFGMSPSCGRSVVVVPTSARADRAPPVLPNPSLKWSPNGGPRGPGRRYPVHFRQPGPGVLPLSPA